MMLDRWRARRAIRTRSAPAHVADPPDPLLFEAVESLKAELGCLDSLGDPSWHFRWEGELQLVGLDATSRSVTDVRQRLLRLVHETTLRHLPRRVRRVVAVLLVQPGDEGPRGWYARLDDDHGEVGRGDWRAARRHVAVLLVDRGGRGELFGADREVSAAVERWRAARGGAQGAGAA